MENRCASAQGGLRSRFFGEVVLDGIDEDEFGATGAFVIKPAPLEFAFFAKVMDLLDAAGDQFGGIGHADPGGGSVHAEADFAIDRGRKHFEEPLLLEDRRRERRDFRALGWLAGSAHRRNKNQSGDRRRYILRAVRLSRGGEWFDFSKGENGDRSVKEVTRAVQGPSSGRGRDGGGSSGLAQAGWREGAARRFPSSAAEAAMAGARSGSRKIGKTGRRTALHRKISGRRFRACLCAEVLVLFPMKQGI